MSDKAIKDFKESISGKGEVVSFILGWHLRNATGEYSHLVEMAKKAGLDKLLPGAPTPDARLRRATAKIKREHGVAFRRMKKDPDAFGWITYRPIKAKDSARSQAVDPRFRQDTALKAGAGIAVNVDDGEIVVEETNSNLLTETVQAYQALEGKFFHETVSLWLHRVMNSHFCGAPFPATGGAHIIPAGPDTESDLNNIRGIVESIGESKFDFEGFNKATPMANNAAVGLLGVQWTTMMGELEGFLSTALEGDLTHPTGFTAKLSQAEALRGRLDLYGKILDRDKAGMSKALEAMTQATETLLKATTEARALKKAKGSEIASQIASQTMDKASKEAQSKLSEAKNLWAPIHATEEE